MATGLASDFKIYDAQFQSGLVEKLTQNAEIFNAASGGAIRLETRDILGNYEKAALTLLISSLVSRRDATSVSAATALKPTQDEAVSVKLLRKMGPIDFAFDAPKKIGMSPEAYSLLLGEQIGTAMALAMVNSAVKAAVAAISGVSAVVNDVTSGAEKLTTVNLIGGRALFGDRWGAIRCWVMHSKPFHDLAVNQIAEGLDTISGLIMGGGTPQTLGLPFVVTDDASLVLTSPTPDQYYTLGLVEGAVVVTESEGRSMVSDIITGLENLVYRMQGEFAYNVGVKGFRWDTANGGANPDDTALATSSNWDKFATNNKDIAGVAIKTI